MAKRIIILEQLDNRQYRYALWADVPAARQSLYAASAQPTAYTLASVNEKAALADGSVAEKIGVIEAISVAEARQMLVDLWTEWQAQVSNRNPWIRYGTFWNGTGWTAEGVE